MKAAKPEVLDPKLAEELNQLTSEQRALVMAEQQLRQRASALAKELELDRDEVYHQLKQFARSPSERLRLGLNHGRRRPRI